MHFSHQLIPSTTNKFRATCQSCAAASAVLPGAAAHGSELCTCMKMKALKTIELDFSSPESWSASYCLLPCATSTNAGMTKGAQTLSAGALLLAGPQSLLAMRTAFYSMHTMQQGCCKPRCGFGQRGRKHKCMYAPATSCQE